MLPHKFVYLQLKNHNLPGPQQAPLSDPDQP